jgi:hypothetical protein
LPGAIHDQELVFEEKRLRNDGTDAARTEQPSQDGNEMDEKNGQIAHRRMVAGRGILRNLGRNNNSPATRITWLVVNKQQLAGVLDGQCLPGRIRPEPSARCA